MSINSFCITLIAVFLFSKSAIAQSSEDDSQIAKVYSDCAVLFTLVTADDKNGIDVELKKSLKSAVTNLYFFAAALAGTKQKIDALWATSLEKEQAELEAHQGEQYTPYIGKRMYECSVFHAAHADRLGERVQAYRDSIGKSSQ